MKGYLKNDPRPSKMRFEVVSEGRGWSIYFCSDTERKYFGIAPTKEAAEMAVAKLAKTFGEVKADKTRLSKSTLERLNKTSKRRLQATAMALDPVRAYKFYEELLMLNHSLHMLSSAFDEVDDLFGSCIDMSTREHYKIASKHITALLDAVLASQIQGTEDDYMTVYEKSMYVKDRITPLIAHVMTRTKENQWRLDELDRVLDNIMPDEWIAEQRQEVADKLMKSIKREQDGEE